VVARRGEDEGVLAVAEGEERRLLAGEPLLDEEAGAGAVAGAELGDGGGGLVGVGADARSQCG
jgi:hypothetical protein